MRSAIGPLILRRYFSIVWGMHWHREVPAKPHGHGFSAAINMKLAGNIAEPFARDMETELADQFVGMYVNKWTLGYGEKGRKAVQELITRGTRAGIIAGPDTVEFLGD